MKRSLDGVAKSRCSYPDYDLLGSQKFHKSHLVSPDGNPVPLRGKIVALYFLDLNDPMQFPQIHTWIINFYKAVMENKDPNFDMVFVAKPPPAICDDDNDDFLLPVFNRFISTLPFASVPFQDRHWRSHLFHNFFNCNLWVGYMGYDISTIINIAIIDACDGKILYPSALSYILQFGPYLYPFTEADITRVFHTFARKDICLQDLLGSDSRDFLLDSRSNRVPISELEKYESIGIYAYTRESDNSDSFRKYLLEFYEKVNYGGNKRFEIVLIDLMTESSYSEEEEVMPWLTLPFGDKKTWILTHMITRDPMLRRDHDWDDPENPILFIKPKGVSSLEFYGHQISLQFGPEAFPFTERAVATHCVQKIQQWNLDFVIEKLSEIGVNLNRLVRYNFEKGATEGYTLSSLRNSSSKKILMFAQVGDDYTKKAMDILSEQGVGPFEVIFLSSYDKEDTDFAHLSNISWCALEEELDSQACEELEEESNSEASEELDEDVWKALNVKTGNLWDFDEKSFLTFAGDGTLIGAGKLNSCAAFPLTSEEELIKEAAFCLWTNHIWWRFSYQCFRWLQLED